MGVPFVEEEIEPYAHESDEAGRFPREFDGELRRSAAWAWLSEEDGPPNNHVMWIVAVQELGRAGTGGMSASLESSSIGGRRSRGSSRTQDAGASRNLLGSACRTERWFRRANVRTTARREGDLYVNGERTFITSGIPADYMRRRCVPAGRGPPGVCRLPIEGDAPGVSRTPLKKMGWWPPFRQAPRAGRQPSQRRGASFKIILHNFNSERLTMATGCTAAACVCLDEAIAYAKERHTFGREAVAAFVTLRAGQQADDAALIAFVKGRVASYKVPTPV